jgi:hypothetical protein
MGVIPVSGRYDSAPGPAAATGQLRRETAANDPLGGSALPGETSARLSARRGRGEKLPADIAGSMGNALGAGLDAVRIHRDGEAAKIARSVQAKAFTEGTDIYFGAGTFSPGTTGGQHLLAHELAHVVQHSRGEYTGDSGTIGRAADPAEAAADRVADGVMSALRRKSGQGEKGSRD